MKNDGGPAFPYGFVTDHATIKVQDGMSLRDWFAGRILPQYSGKDFESAAKLAYQYADAMLAERERGKTDER